MIVDEIKEKIKILYANRMIPSAEENELYRWERYTIQTMLFHKLSIKFWEVLDKLDEISDEDLQLLWKLIEYNRSVPVGQFKYWYQL